uniref:Ribosomal protein L20 n=1 Tax=Imasa heleensis TaxID=2772037 RepID=A0A893DCY9_9EUKA|nr:ribosomal protein L20 [Imasa heleensis]QRR29768.1 ribosomal protein L20 [Imasa heleensis]
MVRIKKSGSQFLSKHASNSNFKGKSSQHGYSRRESIISSIKNSTIHRKLNKRNLRSKNISNISSYLTTYNYNYSNFIRVLSKSEINLNRSILSHFSQSETKSLKSLIFIGI